MQDYVCNLLNYDLATLKELKSSLASRLINLLDHSLQLGSCAERTEQILNSLLPH